MVKIFKASKQSKLAGKVLSLTIERLDINGLGVANYQGKPVFIAQALPGERVVAKVFEEKSKYLKAKLESVANDNEQRITPKCQHYNQCGGCDLQHLSDEQQRRFKQKKISDLFARQNISDLPWQEPIFDQAWHYRRKARIGVQYNKRGEPIIGFRKRSSNEITSIISCSVLETPLADVFLKLRESLVRLTQHKPIGHIEVFSTDKVTLVIRQLVQLNRHDFEVWAQAAKANKWQVFIDDGKKVLSLTAAYSQTSEEECEHELYYSIFDNLNVHFRPSDFIQVNLKINQMMVKQAMQWLELSDQDNVLDLFCGLGNFSLAIAHSAYQVVGVEGVKEMSDQAALNAAHNNIKNCTFYHADLNANWGEQVWAKQTFNKVLLDPARAGALEACHQLTIFKPKNIVYVSCDPSTLARDSNALINAGYKIKKIALIDMFSQTKHVETMVLFEQS
jgi:23S rRNA (uracil1939-C5)-methyltransferase